MSSNPTTLKILRALWKMAKSSQQEPIAALTQALEDHLTLAQQEGLPEAEQAPLKEALSLTQEKPQEVLQFLK